MIGEKINKIITEDITKVENYEEALQSKEMYVMHHKLEMFFTMKELIAMGRYYHVPARELIFLKKVEHDNNIFWHKGASIGYSKASKSKKGKPAWNKGKTGFGGYKLSEEARRRQSEAQRKIPHIHNIGKHWYNNGQRNIMAFECPDGFVKGKKITDENKRKITEAHKGKPSRTKGKTWKLVDGKRVYSDK